MAKRRNNWLLIGCGVVVMLLIVGVALIGGAGYWFYQQLGIQSAERSPEDAAREMEALRARFGDERPLIVVEEEGEAKVDLEGRPRDHRDGLTALHVAAFDPGDGQLVRFSIPFWLMRLSPEGKISIGGDVLENVEGSERLTVQELERVGPGLLIDERKEDGGWVLVWTE